MLKRNRIDAVLEELLQNDKERLSNITPRELSKDNRLSGIHLRTIHDTLKSYRLAKRITIPARQTKEQKVTLFLEKLEKKLPVRDFAKLGYDDLIHYPELIGIGKTTIVMALARCKEKRLPAIKKPNLKIKDFSEENLKEVSQNVIAGLKRLKTLFNLDQQDLADYLGVSARKLSSIEAGNISISIDLLTKLYYMFDVDINSFLFRKGALFKKDSPAYRSEFDILLITLAALKDLTLDQKKQMHEMKDKLKGETDE